MSKGLGQKIVIKFTEDLVGDVSGIIRTPDTFRDNTNFTKSTTTTSRTNGLRFSPTEDIEVTTFKIYEDAIGQEITMHLWDVATQELIISHTFVLDANGWNTGILDKPIELLKSHEYIISCNAPIGDGYYHNSSLIDGFSDNLNVLAGHRLDSQDTYPDQEISAYYISVGFDFNTLFSKTTEAFKVKGQEEQYVNGPLVDKEYLVSNVDRYSKIRPSLNRKTLELEKSDTLINLWDGTYTNRYLSGCSFYDSSGTKVTNEIKVIEGLAYTFSGGNRCRLRWNDIDGNCIKSEDLGNTGSPIKATAPANATGVYYYFTNTEIYDPVSVTQSEERLYFSNSIIKLNNIKISFDFYFNYEADIPLGTSIDLEYSIDDINWIPINKLEIIHETGEVSLKLILKTNDNKISPTIRNIWIEYVNVPDNLLELDIDIYERFNNVQSNLTVEYDASKGTLSGRGGAVESFTKTFTPTDLIPLPDPHVVEKFTVGANANIDFTKVNYNSRYGEEKFTVSASANIEFTYVGVVNP